MGSNSASAPQSEQDLWAHTTCSHHLTHTTIFCLSRTRGLSLLLVTHIFLTSQAILHRGPFCTGLQLVRTLQPLTLFLTKVFTCPASQSSADLCSAAGAHPLKQAGLHMSCLSATLHGTDGAFAWLGSCCPQPWPRHHGDEVAALWNLTPCSDFQPVHVPRRPMSS